jgi:hypothetical protein
MIDAAFAIIFTIISRTRRRKEAGDSCQWLVQLRTVLSGNRREFSYFGGSSWRLAPASVVELARGRLSASWAR